MTKKRTVTRQKEYCHWITYRFEGKMHQLGPYNTEEQANEDGMLCLDVPFDIHYLPTCDDDTATRMLKYGRLKKDGPKNAMDRVRHDRPEEPLVALDNLLVDTRKQEELKPNHVEL